MEKYDLSRFTEAHKRYFPSALREIKAGKKRTHWMWFIFPQIQGLGRSDNATYYAIKDIGEAKAFLNDKYLGGNLIEISNALLDLETDDPYEVFSSPDDIKLRSSMTLFSVASDDSYVFDAVLDKYYDGDRDDSTLDILEAE